MRCGATGSEGQASATNLDPQSLPFVQAVSGLKALPQADAMPSCGSGFSRDAGLGVQPDALLALCRA